MMRRFQMISHSMLSNPGKKKRINNKFHQHNKNKNHENF
jgi:hypothetical protein